MYFLKELSEKASDIAFLDILLRQTDMAIARVEDKIKLNLALRLLELGFAKQAQRITEGISNNPVSEMRQILTARISLALDQPFQAQAELIGLTSETAQIIRANAKHMSGAHEEAYALYENTNNPDKAFQSAWLAENWRELTMNETSIFGAVAALPNPKDPSRGGQGGMLDRTKKALKESSSARQTLRDLLATSSLNQ